MKTFRFQYHLLSIWGNVSIHVVGTALVGEHLSHTFKTTGICHLPDHLLFSFPRIGCWGLAVFPAHPDIQIFLFHPPGAFPNVSPAYSLHHFVRKTVEVCAGAGVKDPVTGVVQPTHGTKKTSQLIYVIFGVRIRVTLGFGTVKAGSSAAYCAIQ